jgi:hypothetical protein
MILSFKNSNGDRVKDRILAGESAPDRSPNVSLAASDHWPSTVNPPLESSLLQS